MDSLPIINSAYLQVFEIVSKPTGLYSMTEFVAPTSEYCMNDSDTMISYILPYPNDRIRLAFFKMASINYFMQIQTLVKSKNESNTTS